MGNPMTRIKETLAKQELSAFDVSWIIKSIGEAWSAITIDARIEAEQTRKDANTLLEHVQLVLGKVEEAREALDAAVDESVKAADAAWATYRDARDKIERQFSGLPASRSAPPLYDMEKTVEVAMKLDRLTDEQWQRVIELARALGRRD
jgi:hypothetical protein